MKTCRLRILCLHVFNTQDLHLLQVDMQGLSSSSTAVQAGDQGSHPLIV